MEGGAAARKNREGRCGLLRITTGRLKSHMWIPEKNVQGNKRVFPLMFQARGRVRKREAGRD